MLPNILFDRSPSVKLCCLNCFAEEIPDHRKESGQRNMTDQPLLIYSVGHNQTYVIEKLSPYTLYRVRVRTCLPDDTEEVDCVTGEEKSVRTLPARPEDQPPPSLKAIGSRVVDITWEPPKKENGIITQYQVRIY